ncbi:hypothetical protein G6514_005672 [Epicoccum nigrum]|nr:hypothetical protein G6514_005672 [Epicoccum nigrum]
MSLWRLPVPVFMRLLTVSDNDELSLVERVGNDIPPYAILSHTWGADNDEISYKDLVDGRYKDKKGFLKLDFCQKRIAVDDLKYFWVDTCCIDKSSSAELTEAINSMFRWYQGAAKCYVFLSDVTVTTNLASDAWRQALRSSRWFRRGWTLQELIAPAVVDFFDSNGTHLGDKNSLFNVIHEITRLPLNAVQGRSLGDFSVNVRLSWAGGRETKREEDAAYSLLGIFDVYMPLIYGEGRQRAFRRLLKELSDLEKPSLWSTQSAIQDPQQRQNLESKAPQAISSSMKTSVLEKYDPVNATSQKGTIALMPMWPGDCIRTTHSSIYVKQRDSVSNAAKTGRWSEVLEQLDLATEEYGENWSNVVRLSRYPA